MSMYGDFKRTRQETTVACGLWPAFKGVCVCVRVRVIE
jgi:hypothetical protein